MNTAHIVTAWFVIASGMVIFIGLVGAGINKHAFGILVDSRNRMSLSRLQMTFWTILIVSAFLAAALATEVMTVSIYIPPELWAALGITTGSTAGAVIVKGAKAGQEPDISHATVNSRMAAQPKQLGILKVADKPKFSDMFKGEEIMDFDYVDIGKVQMFFFTVAILASYAGALYDTNLTLHPAGLPVSDAYDLYFPPISTAAVSLLGISHAGYLTVKASPNTPTK